MENRVSIRGRTARKMVHFANHFPLLGGKSPSGEVRKKLSEREKMWECPEHLEWEVIPMEGFQMELLKKKGETSKGIILQLHGGGYYGKLHNTYRDMAGLYNELSNGFDVLSVD